jgi:EmrB/QacA subfamily drug resistance transporter
MSSEGVAPVPNPTLPKGQVAPGHVEAAAPPDQAAARRILPWLVAVALFMESLDTTILNTAVPTIATALGVAVLSMKAALTSYTISLAVFIPVSGWIADRFGTRRVFFTAIGVFTLGSIACGLSVSMPMLVASRVLQGCGGALMMPVGRITLVRTFPRSGLLKAMSFVAIPGLIGPLVGPLAGGFLVAYSHWRMIFFVNVPVGVIGAWLAFRHMPDYRAKRSDPLDMVGLVLFGAGIALLSYVLEVFGEHTLSLRACLFLLAISLLLLGGYGLHARREKHPLLRLALFKVRTFRAPVVGGFLTRLGAGGMPFLLPLLYQVGMGYSPVQSGLLIMPQPLTAIGLRLLMTRLLKRYGYRSILIINTVAMGVVIMLFALVAPGTPVALIVLGAAGLGFFSTMQYTAMASLTFADIPDAQASMGSSIASTVQQMSLSFGVAAASLATALFVGDKHPAPAVMISGIHKALVAMGILTIAAGAIFLQLKPGDGANVSRQAEL